MSHFCVIVVGDHWEEQLAPFCEENPVVFHEGKDGGYWTNPQAKWDWYVMGGRWKGFFKIKNGAEGELGESGVYGNEARDGWVDQARICDLDFDGMRQEIEQEAINQYERFKIVTEGKTVPPTWEEFRKMHEGRGCTIEFIRQEWAKIPWVKALRDNNLDPILGCAHKEWFVNNGGMEAFVKDAGDSCFVPFAVLYNGEWIERGEMGWFGCVSNEEDPEKWVKKVNELIRSLPDSTLLTAVDCHI